MNNKPNAQKARTRYFDGHQGKNDQTMSQFTVVSLAVIFGLWSCSLDLSAAISRYKIIDLGRALLLLV